MFVLPPVEFRATLAGQPPGSLASFDTIRRMRALVRQYASHPAILNQAANIVWFSPVRDERHEARELFQFVKNNVRYTKDVVGLETLATPLLVLQRRVGDCDDMATLLATLLESVGHPTRFVMGAYHGSPHYEHVYLQTFVNGEWIDADPSMPNYSLGDSPPDPSKLWIENV